MCYNLLKRSGDIMNKNVKDLVDYYEIDEKRDRLSHNKLLILRLNKDMSDLKLNRNVSMYAYDLDKLKYCDDFEKSIIKEEMRILERDKDVILYKELLIHVHRLENEIKEYYKTINIDLREGLMDLDYPDIFVNQGYVDSTRTDKFARNVIIPGSLIIFDECDEKLIDSYRELNSKRRKRHFYNQVSFRYLEELSKDCSFGLEGKNLGNVKVLKK